MRNRLPRSSATPLHPSVSFSASSTVSGSSVSAASRKSMLSLSSGVSSQSFKTRCKRTGEFCAAGHELVQIPVLDRQRYLQHKEDQLLMQEQRYRHPHDTPMTICSTVSNPSSIIIECDCCSRTITKEFYIAGCCMECDIDVCGDCFKNGQSYVDVVLKESRENDISDERQQQQHQQQQQQYSSYVDQERYNGRRPTYIGTGRVTYDDFPDPAAFQWSFTGSSSNDHERDSLAAITPIEYFEKDFGKEVGVIRLDFYYTIGVVRTTIVDPIEGTIQKLFTKSRHKMSPQSYRKILKDPRSYTNERYKKGRPSGDEQNNYYERRQFQQVL